MFPAPTADLQNALSDGPIQDEAAIVRLKRYLECAVETPSAEASSPRAAAKYVPPESVMASVAIHALPPSPSSEHPSSIADVHAVWESVMEELRCAKEQG